jgi:hypothetical protein
MIGQQSSTDGSAVKMETSSERSVVAEFVDAARSAAESLLQEQQQQVADRVSGIAAALEGAARSLDHSQNRVIASYVQQAGTQVSSFARTLQDRRWNELVADTEDFARCQPTWFVLAAVAAGFVAGRFLWAAMSVQGRNADAVRAASRRETTREVTAAISSAPGAGSGTGETTGHAAGSSGAMETR